MSCNFCSKDNMTTSDLFRPKEEFDDYIVHNSSGYTLEVYYECGDYAELKNIHYCPFCGTYLGEVEDGKID